MDTHTRSDGGVFTSDATVEITHSPEGKIDVYAKAGQPRASVDGAELLSYLGIEPEKLLYLTRADISQLIADGTNLRPLLGNAENPEGKPMITVVVSDASGEGSDSIPCLVI